MSPSGSVARNSFALRSYFAPIKRGSSHKLTANSEQKSGSEFNLTRNYIPPSYPIFIFEFQSIGRAITRFENGYSSDEPVVINAVFEVRSSSPNLRTDLRWKRNDTSRGNRPAIWIGGCSCEWLSWPNLSAPGFLGRRMGHRAFRLDDGGVGSWVWCNRTCWSPSHIAGRGISMVEKQERVAVSLGYTLKKHHTET